MAEAIAEKASTMLHAHATVVDEQGTVIAATESRLLGAQFDRLPTVNSCARVPLHFDERAGEIIVAPQEGEEIPPRLAHAMVDLIVHQAASEWFPDRAALKNKLVHDLLFGDDRDEQTLLREASVLGMDLAALRAVILIDAAPYILEGRGIASDMVERKANFLISSIVSFFELPNDTICAYIGKGEIVVLKATTSRDLFLWTQTGHEAPRMTSWANLDALKRAARDLVGCLKRDTGLEMEVAVGRYHPGIHGLAKSYRDAEAALQLGRCFPHTDRVSCLDSLGLLSFVGVADSATKMDLASQLLSPLQADSELMHTLTTFFANDCSASRTARGLCIHRNTLAYRLAKIASLTGLDPTKFDDAVQIKVAMTIRALSKAA